MASTAPGVIAGKRRPRRVPFLDGLRGVAALYVVVAHALAINLPSAASATEGVYSTGGAVDRLLYLGLDAAIVFSRFGVVVFIVLSGCSLMLPVAQSADGRLPGGFRTYVVRRARRILPPYYAALAISLGLIAVVPGMNPSVIPWWEGALPAFDPDVLLSHLLLIHNWSADWAYRINPPLWTIPIEWQIYLLFPLILLPVWQRLGNIAAVAIAFTIGMGLFALGAEQIVQSAPWFVGLFALGMAAASYGFSGREAELPLPIPIPAMIGVTLATCVTSVAVILITGIDFALAAWVPDILIGIATALLIVHCARDRPSSSTLRTLEWGPVVTLGWFSYSLYLMHAPILVICALVVRALESPAWSYVPAVGLGIAFALIGTYAFHVVFERPFMPRHLRHVTRSDTQPGLAERGRGPT